MRLNFGMGAPELRLLCLAFFALLPLEPALGRKLGTGRLQCEGLHGFEGEGSVYERKSSSVSSVPFIRGSEVKLKCANSDLSGVRVRYGDGFDPSSVGNFTWTCTTYGNGHKNFTAMEITVSKPKNGRGSGTKTTCTYLGDDCPLVRESDEEIRFIIGMPHVCVKVIDYVLPSEATALDCSGLSDSSDSDSIFKRENWSGESWPLILGLEYTVRCPNTDQDSVRVRYGGDFIPRTVGTYRWTCTSYGNGNRNFTVMEVTLHRSEKSGEKSTCTFYDGRSCPRARESEFESRFVVGMPEVCDAYVENPETCKYDVDCLNFLSCVDDRCVCTQETC